MALNLRRLFRLNINLTNSILSKTNFINVGRRSLYSERDIGVTAYENTRFIFRNQFMTIEDTFRSKMKDLCSQEDGMIYTEDLKAMLHLIQNTEEDLNLLTKMLEKYVTYKHEHKLGTYVFGPVVMRMFYYLNQPERALALYENEILHDSFNYRTSFRTLMCLLYKNSMYAEVRSIFDKVYLAKGMEFIGGNSVILFASCLKENTPESFTYALSIWKKQFETMKLSTRANSMVALLAIKNQAAETALEILSLVDRDRTASVRSLKILAFMNLRRYLQIIPLLKSSLEQNDVSFRPVFFADVIYELEEQIKEDNVIERDDLLKLVETLKLQEKLDTQTTLEEFLFKPIVIVHKGQNVTQRDQMGGRNRFQTPNNRIGLKNYL